MLFGTKNVSNLHVLITTYTEGFCNNGYGCAKPNFGNALVQFHFILVLF